MKRKIFTLLLVLCSVMTIHAQRYVMEKGSGDKSGIGGWENASNDLQKMIDELAEEGGGEVWVAQGVYIPTKKIAETDEAGNPTTNRDKAFILQKNVSVYGGFAGGETTLSARDWENNITVLSGRLKNEESAYHVVVSVGEDDMGGVEFDGFTITGGRALYTEADPAAKMEGAEHPFKKAISIQGKENGVDKEYKLPRESGAGVYIFGCSNLTMNNLKVTGNSGTQDVGVRIRACVGSVLFSNSIIYNNIALIGGNAGGYFNGSALRNTPLSLSNIIVRDNENINNSALTIHYCILDMKDLTIENNTTTESGSFVSFFMGYSEVNVENLWVKNNISVSGVNVAFEKLRNSSLMNVYIMDNKNPDGTAGAGGVQMNNMDNVTITGLVVKGHNRSSNTGGFYLVNSNAITIEDFKIEENQAGQKFGGLYIHNSQDVVLTKGEIKKNSSSDTGGGMSLMNSSVMGVNLLIADNTSSTGNSALFMDKTSSLHLTNSTIVHNNTQSNTATGGVDFNLNVTLNNSIVWGNENGSGLSNSSGTIPAACTFNLIEGVDLSSTGQDLNGLDGTDNLTYTADNIFVDYAKCDYRLNATSPVIDKGDDDLVTDINFDLDGHSRILGGGVDLGAYEYEADENPVFEGGLKNGNGEYVFTYSGSEIDLKVANIPDGTGVTYAWENNEISENGTGLPVNGGAYTVTATVDGFGPIQGTVVIEKRYLPIHILDDKGSVLLNYSWSTDTGETENLSADYDVSLAGSLNISFMSSKPETVFVTPYGAVTALGTGSAVIRTVTEEGNVLFHRNYDVSEGLSAFRVTLFVDADVPADTEFDEEVIVKDGVIFEGDVIFKDKVTFEGGSEFRGNVTFEDGADFPNNLPVFNGNVTITGEIILPEGETLVIDNDGSTITINGEASFSEDVTIDGGTLAVGNLVVNGDLTLNDVTVKVEPGAFINAGEIIVNTPPKSIIDLGGMPTGTNDGLTIGIITDNPSGLFDITNGENTNQTWNENGDGTWTLTVTRYPDPTPEDPDPDPDPEVFSYPVTYDAGQWGEIILTGNDTEIAFGTSVNAGTQLLIQARSNFPGMELYKLTVNGTEVANNSTITVTDITHIIAEFTLGGVDPNPDPTDNVMVGGTHLWTSDGYLYIQANHSANIYVVSMGGRVVTNQKVQAGETSIPLTKGIYVVKVDNKVTKIIVR